MRRRGPVALLIAASSVAAVGVVMLVGMTPAEPETVVVFPGPSADTLAREAAALHVPEEVEPEEERDPIPTDEDSRAAFEARYPDQAAASAGDEPWALLIGINEHVGAVSDNYVSREDAESLREILLASGWSDDRIVLMTDTDATGVMIREGLSWLARKADDGSRVVFHFSGHSKKWYGDGGAILDEALWPTDDDFVRRDELADMLTHVRHDQFWGNFATCNAEGFHEAGLAAPGRVLTYSSRTAEKSYEDPSAGHSVWGAYLLDHALLRGGVTGPGNAVSVQDAFAFAAPMATTRTSTQVPYGPQTPVLVDDLGEPFVLSPGGPVEQAAVTGDLELSPPAIPTS
ncbi:caspase family protein [Nitriliruptoraceae bacterium ZYF776]|nr:caspase family protein [Profundirhabdus halotolerans]